MKPHRLLGASPPPAPPGLTALRPRLRRSPPGIPQGLRPYSRRLTAGRWPANSLRRSAGGRTGAGTAQLLDVASLRAPRRRRRRPYQHLHDAMTKPSREEGSAALAGPGSFPGRAPAPRAWVGMKNRSCVDLMALAISVGLRVQVSSRIPPAASMGKRLGQVDGFPAVAPADNRG